MRQRPGSHIQLSPRLGQRDGTVLAGILPGTAAVAVAEPALLRRPSGRIQESASGSAAQPSPRPRRVFASLDGLRGLAILLVVWCHTDAALSGYVRTWPLDHVLGGAAATGVELFFVLSGFLLFLPFARAIIAGDHWPSVGQFYVRRALRILPGYYILIPMFLLLAHLFPYGVALRHAGSLPVLLGLALMYDFQNDASNLVTGFDGPLWTLAIEWQFYLLLPWLAHALARLVSPVRRRMPRRPGHHGWPWELFAGLGAVMVIGVVARSLGASAHYVWGYPAATQTHPWLSMLLSAVYGARGKYIEVFALGMLASAV